MKINKIIVSVIAFILMASSCQNDAKDTSNQKVLKDSIPEVSLVQRLNEYYDKSHGGSDSIRYKNLFITAFPSSFNSFYQLYGYSDKNGAMPLYKQYEKHINFLCTGIDVNVDGLDKLIKLGIDGHWEADAVDLLQQCIVAHVAEKVDLTVEQLKKMKSSEVSSFWYFFYDGPHPDDAIVKKRYTALFSKVKTLDASIANSMKIEYDKLIKESDKHGR